MTPAKAEFADLLAKSGLSARYRSQAALAALFGVTQSTVNRWLASQADAFDPPPYAVLFLRAFVRLPDDHREEVLSDAAETFPDPRHVALFVRAYVRLTAVDRRRVLLG